MNRKSRHGRLTLQTPRQLKRCLVHLATAAVIITSQSTSMVRAQMTLDGTHCVLFSDQPVGELARCVTRRADRSTLTLSMTGKPPNHLRRIELSINGLAPFQVIDVIAEPIIDRQNIGLLITDMNFDGFEDFAVMEFQAAGPDVPYVYFLFNTDTQLFENSAELADITSPVFDPTSRQISSRWRDGATRSGSDIYIWQGGNPVLSKRIEQHRGDETCSEQHFVYRNGKRELTKTQDCSN